MSISVQTQFSALADHSGSLICARNPITIHGSRIRRDHYINLYLTQELNKERIIVDIART